MDFFGLDLGTNLIKAVQLKKAKDQPVLVAAGSIPTPPKALISDSPLDQEAVAEAIKKLLVDAKISTRNVNVALPDSKVFSLVKDFPLLTEKELGEALKWEAEQDIPFPLEEVNLDFSILEKNEKTKKMQVLLVAAPIRLIEKYSNILKLAGLSPLSLETEIIAVSRVIAAQISQDSNDNKVIMVLNLGSSATNFSILKRGAFSFAGSISSGGDALTRALAQELGFDIKQAEEYKKTYGLEEGRLEGKVVAAIKPIMEKIIREIKKALSFYQTKNPSDKVNSLILTGGTARLLGIASYLTQNLGIETQIGNPWSKVRVDEKKFAHCISDSILFVTATGLALRES